MNVEEFHQWYRSLDEEDIIADDWEAVYTRKDFERDLELIAAALERMRGAGITPYLSHPNREHLLIEGEGRDLSISGILFKALGKDQRFREDVVGTSMVYLEGDGWTVHP